MKERVVRIGDPVPLIGVMVQPKALDKNKPAVLLLNSGVMHHVGACGLSVRLARSFAETGFLSVRFDFSGIGDSEPRAGSASFEELAPKECMEVMDYVQKKTGINKFILYGLCSGSDAAYEAALVDERVVGVGQIDAYCYKTLKFYLYDYWPKLFKLKHWKSFIGRKLGLKPESQQAHSGQIDESEREYYEMPTYIRVFPPKASIENGLETLMKRGVRFLTVFTGAESAYSYKNQFFESFRRVIDKSLYDIEYYKNASHIIQEPNNQEIVVARFKDWVSSF
ncbi:MAG: hypothetical protein KJP25_07220 [Gammaproteobacteria bacterium]|nr:hypothetical protein [Gammaproteobacteria bacterium]